MAIQPFRIDVNQTVLDDLNTVWKRLALHLGWRKPAGSTGRAPHAWTTFVSIGDKVVPRSQAFPLDNPWTTNCGTTAPTDFLDRRFS